MPATHEDAVLLVQLMRWGTESGVDDALSYLFSDEFSPEKEKLAPDAAVRQVLVFGETVGALVKHGLLNLDLIRDVYWFDGMWSKVGPHALAARAQEGEPTLYENFEALVQQGSPG
jgi:hypothetical protein